jgi:hypothetical protein
LILAIVVALFVAIRIASTGDDPKLALASPPGPHEVRLR